MFAARARLHDNHHRRRCRPSSDSSLAFFFPAMCAVCAVATLQRCVNSQAHTHKTDVSYVSMCNAAIAIAMASSPSVGHTHTKKPHALVIKLDVGGYFFPPLAFPGTASGAEMLMLLLSDAALLPPVSRNENDDGDHLSCGVFSLSRKRNETIRTDRRKRSAEDVEAMQRWFFFLHFSHHCEKSTYKQQQTTCVLCVVCLRWGCLDVDNNKPE